MKPIANWPVPHTFAGLYLLLFVANAVVPVVATDQLIIGCLASALLVGIWTFDQRTRRPSARARRLDAQWRAARARERLDTPPEE